jgi:hypothetical protein
MQSTSATPPNEDISPEYRHYRQAIDDLVLERNRNDFTPEGESRYQAALAAAKAAFARCVDYEKSVHHE